MAGEADDRRDLRRKPLVKVLGHFGHNDCPGSLDSGHAGKLARYELMELGRGFGNGLKAEISVPEGHDKPYKYPNIFAISEAVILNKYDTVGVFDFDEDEFRSVVGSLNAAAPIFPISATKGDGVDAWVEWLAARIEDVRNG